MIKKLALNFVFLTMGFSYPQIASLKKIQVRSGVNYCRGKNSIANIFTNPKICSHFILLPLLMIILALIDAIIAIKSSNIYVKIIISAFYILFLILNDSKAIHMKIQRKCLPALFFDSFTIMIALIIEEIPIFYFDIYKSKLQRMLFFIIPLILSGIDIWSAYFSKNFIFPSSDVLYLQKIAYYVIILHQRYQFPTLKRYGINIVLIILTCVVYSLIIPIIFYYHGSITAKQRAAYAFGLLLIPYLVNFDIVIIGGFSKTLEFPFFLAKFILMIINSNIRLLQIHFLNLPFKNFLTWYLIISWIISIVPVGIIYYEFKIFEYWIYFEFIYNLIMIKKKR